MRNPTRMRRTAATLGVIALAAAGATGTTWAAFSDFAVVPDNAVGAATVVVGAGNPGYDLNVNGLVPAQPQSVELTVQYAGTIAADIALDIDPSGSTWCHSDGAPRVSGELQVSTDGENWVSYCGLGHTPDFTLAKGLAPGGSTMVTLYLRLTAETDFRYSDLNNDLSDSDTLTVTAVQSNGGRAFTDYAIGSLTVSAATIAAPVPSECSALGPDEFPRERIIVLTEGDDVRDLSNGKDTDEAGPAGTPTNEALGYLILGLGGNDTITGSNGRDCIVGGDGNDTLVGGNQDDVLLGGDGDDELRGENGEDVLYGGVGNDVLDGGENGKDVLYGGPGNDALDGGNGQDVLDGGEGSDDYCTPDESPQDEITNCEQPQSDDGFTSLRLGEPEVPIAPQDGESAAETGTEASTELTGKPPAEEPVDQDPLTEEPSAAAPGSAEPPVAEEPNSEAAGSVEP